MDTKKVKFYVEYDKSYSHSFASGVEISSISPERIDFSFHYERAHILKEFSTIIDEAGVMQESQSSCATNQDIVEIDRIIKTSVSLDIATANSIIAILQSHLSQIK